LCEALDLCLLTGYIVDVAVETNKQLLREKASQDKKPKPAILAQITTKGRSL
jgi:hypothetical protein